jgi:hypothetical protein
MMYERKPRANVPRSVDEAADLLLSDLLITDIDTMAKLSEKEFYQLYSAVAGYVLDEFRIWTGNEELLNSCFNKIKTKDKYFDPALVILRQVREKIMATSGVMIIT